MTDSECWATFTGENGYPFENELANKRLTVGQRYRVVGGDIGRFHTDLKLEGEEGSYNSVMFIIEGELPFKFEDNYFYAPKR